MIGKIFKLNYGGTCEVVHYENSEKVWVLFDNGYLNNRAVRMSELRRGEVKNPYFPTIYEVGYIGVGVFNAKDEGGDGSIYRIWKNILQRCYCEVSLKKRQSYVGCTVCEEWHNFQNFAEWYYSQIGCDEKYHVDKDILVEGNKVYSPENCCLVPIEINNLFRTAAFKNSNLPIGVTYSKSGKYLSRFSAGKLSNRKVHETVQEAASCYQKQKEEYASRIVEKYREKLDSNLYNKLKNMGNN